MRNLIYLFISIFIFFSFLSFSNDNFEDLINRRVYSFNRGFDRSFSEICVTTYIKVFPSVFDNIMNNFFKNMLEFHNMFFYFLLDDLKSLGDVFYRFNLNFFFGFCGSLNFFCLADFSNNVINLQTFMLKKGCSKINYMMLPIIGPGTFFSNLGLLVEHLFIPFFYFFDYLFFYYFFNFLIQKSLVFYDGSFFHASMLDGYLFLKDAFLQNIERFLDLDLDFVI